MARPYRITISLMMDREAFDEKGAHERAQETAQQAVTAFRRVIPNDVGGRFVAVQIESVEQVERRAGGDRRKEGR